MDKRVLYQMKSLEKTIMRVFFTNFNFKKPQCPPTITQHQIIKYIVNHKNEEIYQKDLEKVLNLRRATVSGVLQTMEKNKLIERVVDLKDTRTKKIVLNKEALDVYNNCENKMNELENIIIKDISDEELEIFCKVINKMKDNIHLSGLIEEKKGRDN